MILQWKSIKNKQKQSSQKKYLKLMSRIWKIIKIELFIKLSICWNPHKSEDIFTDTWRRFGIEFLECLS